MARAGRAELQEDAEMNATLQHLAGVYRMSLGFRSRRDSRAMLARRNVLQ